MEPGKDFKTIEVVDSRTGQLCKIACMSCIRGHRTTSCGIPVCRTKVFWTVKRPGRPSNTCTCRFRSSGRCRCNVAKSACPHRPKRGEKRSVECRCDEQGRFCCLLDSEHWSALTARQNPRVDFFPDREALEAHHARPTASLALPPSSTFATPQATSSIPSTPDRARSVPQPVQDPYNPLQTPITPRFGMMGVGAPWGSDTIHGQDVLVWDGESPQAPREFNPHSASHLSSPLTSRSSMSSPPQHYPFMMPPSTPQQPLHPEYAPVTQSLQGLSMAPQAEDSYFNKTVTNFNIFQFPSAICQNCGRHGCSCKACPTVLQDFQNGSWAQVCLRRHEQTLAPEASSFVETGAGSCCGSKNTAEMPVQPRMGSCCGGTLAQNSEDSSLNARTMQQESGSIVGGMQLEGTINADFTMDEFRTMDNQQSLDLTQYLASDLEMHPDGFG